MPMTVRSSARRRGWCVLTRLWEAFKRWDWPRRVLLLIGAPWLVLLAWMAATGKPRLMTSGAVGATALMWLGFALAPFADNTEQTNVTGDRAPTTDSRKQTNATGGTTTAATADVSTTSTSGNGQRPRRHRRRPQRQMIPSAFPSAARRRLPAWWTVTRSRSPAENECA